MPPILDRIDGPHDLRRLSPAELAELAADIRRRIVEVVSRTGGHLASNLGVVELTIALHRVFRSPRDAIIFDVGHQCYAHKLLTGRRESFASLRTAGGISGFPRRSESVHDPVETGHASTAISGGLGMAVGRALAHVPGRVVAVVGDGALTGGLALAGLNHAGHLRARMVIVLNDNAMSIGRNVGALSFYLGRLTTSRFYRLFRREFDRAVVRLPLIGNDLTRMIARFKRVLKALLFRETLFADLGFEYFGPVDGHDLAALEKAFRGVRDLDAPVVVHVVTRKGRGYQFAEHDPARWHGVGSFSMVDGSIEESPRQSYSEVFAEIASRMADADERVIGVTAAMAEGTGLAVMQRRHPGRVFDVGIAEDHAVTFAAGLARSGRRPIVALYSTFLQRAVDEVIHDVALPRLPVILAVDRAGVVPGDGETHQGLFDIPLFRGVPNLAVLAPAGRGEMERAFRWAAACGGPALIRYPKAQCPPSVGDLADPFVSGRGAFARFHQGEVLIVAVGALGGEAVRAAQELASIGIEADVYSLRFVRPIDEEYLASVLRLYGRVLVAEEGVLLGGAGELVARVAAEDGTGAAIACRGAPDRFLAQGTREQLLAACGLDASSLARAAERLVRGAAAPAPLTSREARG